MGLTRWCRVGMGCAGKQPRLGDGLHGCVHGTGELIAIEVHGRHQFTSNTRAPTGRILARHRLLVARGWAVTHVPSYVWGMLDDAVRGAWLLQARRHPAAQTQASQP